MAKIYFTASQNMYRKRSLFVDTKWALALRTDFFIASSLCHCEYLPVLKLVCPHTCVSVPPHVCVSDFFITHLKLKLRKKALSAQLEDTFWYFTCVSTKFPFYGTYLEKVNYDNIRATKHILCPNVCKSFWQNTSDNSTLCLLYIGFTSKISI